MRGGFIDYRLFRGGLNGSDADDWFLRSDFNGDNGNGGNGEITPPDELPPEALPEDLPTTLPPGVYPIIGPEIATYGAVQPTAPAAWIATLGTCMSVLVTRLRQEIRKAAAETGPVLLEAAPSAGRSTTTIAPSPIRAPTAIWAAF